MGKGQMIIQTRTRDTRMAVLEDGVLQELAVEGQERGSLVGNVYRGRVASVISGMETAFVDIGTERHGFLFWGDLPVGPAAKGPVKPVCEGQEILVQVVKDAQGSKGPKLSWRINLPGRYLALLPNSDYVGISRKIQDGASREKLQQVAVEICPAGMGIIMRTVAADEVQPDDLKRDIQYLLGVWRTVESRCKRGKGPQLLYRDLELLLRIVRDDWQRDLEVYIDREEARERFVELLHHSGELTANVQLYAGKDAIFHHFGVEEQLRQLRFRHVEMDKGGSIVIDSTEALVAIDVNSGGYCIGDKEETAFQINLRAADEIARQLRLRDLGGIILIDFIDMDKREHRQMVVEHLRQALSRDKARTSVVGITSLGLVEMTRHKRRRPIDQVLFAACPCCGGSGRVDAPAMVAEHLEEHLDSLTLSGPSRRKGLQVNLHPDVAAWVREKYWVETVEKRLGIRLTVVADRGMLPDQYMVQLGD